MYLSLRTAPIATDPRVGWRDPLRVSPNVIGLGITSMFTDISSEMVNSVLPLYLTFQLGFSPFALGTFDGGYQGVSALTALLGAAIADRRSRHRQVAAAGYATSTACKLGLLVVRRMWLPATAFLALDRAGKGVRTAPRDALISLSSDHDGLGNAFGVHRALDTAGALLGPLVAWVLLTLVPGAYATVFVASVAFGALGVVVIALFVQDASRRSAPSAARTSARASMAAVSTLLRRADFRRTVTAGTLLAATTLSDPLVYFAIERRTDASVALFPLLFVGTAVSYLILAVPVGRLADRVGRHRVLVGGFTLLLGVYAILAAIAVPSVAVVLLVLALLGAFHATNDGILAALGSAVLPEEVRTTGLAALNGAVAAGGFVSSLAFGAVWELQGSRWAAAMMLVVAAVAAVAAGLLLGRPLRRPVDVYHRH